VGLGTWCRRSRPSRWGVPSLPQRQRCRRRRVLRLRCRAGSGPPARPGTPPAGRARCATARPSARWPHRPSEHALGGRCRSPWWWTPPTAASGWSWTTWAPTSNSAPSAAAGNGTACRRTCGLPTATRNYEPASQPRTPEATGLDEATSLCGRGSTQMPPAQRPTTALQERSFLVPTWPRFCAASFVAGRGCPDLAYCSSTLARDHERRPFRLLVSQEARGGIRHDETRAQQAPWIGTYFSGRQIPTSAGSFDRTETGGMCGDQRTGSVMRRMSMTSASVKYGLRRAQAKAIGMTPRARARAPRPMPVSVGARGSHTTGQATPGMELPLDHVANAVECMTARSAKCLPGVRTAPTAA
jgi:hypothetical protein